MLRGVVAREDETGSNLERIGQMQVQLTERNIPSHEHYNSITSGSGMTCLTKGTSTGSKVPTSSTLAYDMFYDDGVDTGLSDNEMDGTVDEFSVESGGDKSGDNEAEQPYLLHNNVPSCQDFYAFLVTKI